MSKVHLIIQSIAYLSYFCMNVVPERIFRNNKYDFAA